MGTPAAKVAVRYPASQGYVRYEYACDLTRRHVSVEFTGSADQYEAAVLMPPGATPARATLNGQPAVLETRTVESSLYAVIHVNGSRAHTLVVEFA